MTSPYRDSSVPLEQRVELLAAARENDVLHGRVQLEGRLPFELPRSMDAASAQRPDVPHDSGDPLFVFGHGLSHHSAG